MSHVCELSAEDVLLQLGVDFSTGLSPQEVLARQQEHGPNDMGQEDEEPLYMKFLDKLKDPLILLLFAASLVSILLGEIDDAVSIAVAVLIVSTVGFVQEYKSEQSVAALNNLVPHTCNVLRSSQVSMIQAKELVPGDVVCLHTGDRIPADIRLITATNLQVDESSLTGETVLIHKKAEPLVHVGKDPSISEQENIVHMGTLVCTGHARGVVVATGLKTEFGKTFADMKDVEARKTPLQLQMDELGKQLSMISFAVIGVIGLIGVFQGKQLLEMFTIGVSLAVAAIPEGLPICVTVTLALGVMRMSSKNAIVKKLPAVEALGCASVVCTDKTGTLTENRMTVTQIYSPTLAGVVTVQGSRSNMLSGEAVFGGTTISVTDYPCLVQLLEIGCLCNNASLNGDVIVGQPTEGALLVAACRLGVQDRRPAYERISEIPFDSDLKRMEVKCRAPTGVIVTYMKGALESVFEQCNTVCGKDGEPVPITTQTRERIFAEASMMASQGLRVLALAQGTQLNALTFVGMVGIEDPPRHGVDAAITRIRQTGVKVIMITGDSCETARAIGQKIGCFDPLTDSVLSGKEIERLSVDELGEALEGVTVCYRTSPRHKLSIVRALQARNHVVAMTGDGVNDAPALKAADIGVAMGRGGTDVAKEAAHMVIVDDDFSTIVAAIEEGKCIYFNIKNFLTFQLSTSVAALLLVALSNFFNLPNPLNPMQVLWINIIMDGPPAQSLGVEPVDPEIVRRPPRKRSENILSRPLMLRVITSGILIVIGTLFVFVSELRDGEVTKRDTTMTFTTFVLFDMFNALSCRHSTKPILNMRMDSNRTFLLAVGGSLLGQLLVIYFPPLQNVFATTALSFGDLLYVVFLASSLVVLDTIRKTWFAKIFSESPDGSNSVGSLWNGYSLQRLFGVRAMYSPAPTDEPSDIESAKPLKLRD